MSDTNLSPAERLDDFMKNCPGGFSTAKGALRAYLTERKRLIDSGEAEDLDRSTAQGIWYLVEPYLPKPTKKDKTTGLPRPIVRRVFISYIRDICRDELNCRREDLKIVAGGRAELYYNGDWSSISWDNIEELKKAGTDVLMIEKEGMSQVFVGHVEKHGIAIVNTRGFFTDYVGDTSTQSMKGGCNFVLMRDLDPSGILIEYIAKALGIICIGVNDEMLEYLELTREQVRTSHDPTKGNPERASHWKHVQDVLAPTYPEVAKEIPFLKRWRIEIDKVHAVAGTKKMFEYIKSKLEEKDRNLNRVAHPPLTQTPDIILDIVEEMRRIGKNDGIDKANTIYHNQRVWTSGLCEDVEALKDSNSSDVREAIELNPRISAACELLAPILKMLKEVQVTDKYPNLKTDKLDNTIWVDANESAEDEDHDEDDTNDKDQQ